MTKILIEKKTDNIKKHTHTHTIIWLDLSVDVHIDFLINVIHLPVNEFDYLLITQVHVMIGLLLVVLKMLDDTKNIYKSK